MKLSGHRPRKWTRLNCPYADHHHEHFRHSDRHIPRSLMRLQCDRIRAKQKRPLRGNISLSCAFPAPLFLFSLLPGFLLPFPGAFLLLLLDDLPPPFAVLIFPLETSLFLSFPGVFFLSRRRLLPLEPGSHLFPPSAFFSRLRYARSSLSAASCSSLCSLSRRARASLAHRPLATPVEHPTLTKPYKSFFVLPL